MMLVEEVYGKMLVNGLARQEDDGSKEQWKAIQVVTFRLRVMMLVEEVYGKMLVNGLAKQEDDGNKEQWMAEERRRK